MTRLLNLAHLSQGTQNVKMTKPLCHLRIKSAPFWVDLKFKSAHLIPL
jgi:hypothetical protein